MYSHPTMTEEQKRLYMRGWLRMRKRHRRYVRVVMPAMLAGSLSVGAFLGWLLGALFL